MIVWCESLDKLQIVFYIEIQLNNDQKTIGLLYRDLKSPYISFWFFIYKNLPSTFLSQNTKCCPSKRKVDMKTEEVVLCLLHISRLMFYVAVEVGIKKKDVG